MKVRLATEADSRRWDEYLDSAPSNAPLNRYAWKEVLERSYGVRVRFLIASNDGGDICGVLPTYSTGDFVGTTRVYSLRFGLVADSDDVANALLSHLSDLCEENGAASTLVTSGYTRRDTQLQEIRKTTILMDLAQSEEAEWKSLRDKSRNMIRKGCASNLVAEKGFHNLQDFYDIYCAVMLRKGIPIQSLHFFRTVVETLRAQSELIVAKRDDRVIGGLLILFGKDVAIYPWQCSLPESQQYATNQFLLWEAIKACLQRRMLKLDMGECVEGGSVYLFKKNFGGRPQDIYYYAGEPPGRAGNGRRSKPARARALGYLNSQIGRMLTQRSPLWLRRKAGPRVRSRGRIL